MKVMIFRELKKRMAAISNMTIKSTSADRGLAQVSASPTFSKKAIKFSFQFKALWILFSPQK